MARRPFVVILLFALAVQTLAGGRSLDGFVLCLGGQHRDEPAAVVAGATGAACSADCDHDQPAPALRVTHEHECPCIDIALVCIAVRVDMRRDPVTSPDAGTAVRTATITAALAAPAAPRRSPRRVDRVDRAGEYRLAVVRSTRLLV